MASSSFLSVSIVFIRVILLSWRTALPSGFSALVLVRSNYVFERKKKSSFSALLLHYWIFQIKNGSSPWAKLQLIKNVWRTVGKIYLITPFQYWKSPYSVHRCRDYFFLFFWSCVTDNLVLKLWASVLVTYLVKIRIGDVFWESRDFELCFPSD